MPSSFHLDLWDYRRRVSNHYDSARRRGAGEPAWAAWRQARDELFRDHPQSPLDEVTRESFAGLRYFAYQPTWRFEVIVHPFSEQNRTSIGQYSHRWSCPSAPAENRLPVAVRAGERL